MTPVFSPVTLFTLAYFPVYYFFYSFPSYKRLCPASFTLHLCFDSALCSAAALAKGFAALASADRPHQCTLLWDGTESSSPKLFLCLSWPGALTCLKNCILFSWVRFSFSSVDLIMVESWTKLKDAALEYVTRLLNLFFFFFFFGCALDLMPDNRIEKSEVL